MTTNTTKSVRLLSLDFLRGFIMVLLALDACELYSNIRKGIPDKDSIGSKVITQFSQQLGRPSLLGSGTAGFHVYGGHRYGLLAYGSKQ